MEKEMTAKEVSDKTFQQIFRQGFCLWTCDLFDGQKIAVIQDKHIFDRPIRFTDPLRIAFDLPVFTIDELHYLAKKDDRTWLMVREAKSLAPCWIKLEGEN